MHHLVTTHNKDQGAGWRSPEVCSAFPDPNDEGAQLCARHTGLRSPLSQVCTLIRNTGISRYTVRVQGFFNPAPEDVAQEVERRVARVVDRKLAANSTEHHLRCVVLCVVTRW